eukprot:TRINITY_DN64149_c0_g1_i1.p1 TRINITY_DN64149_c0_g1~~TRINITY_DN64149_c0_g1_i1.p1  ORF type:complete len:264 (+),score=40.53 TRINITY_DN64149_c0_g1_i1:48-794(+)
MKLIVVTACLALFAAVSAVDVLSPFPVGIEDPSDPRHHTVGSFEAFEVEDMPIGHYPLDEKFAAKVAAGRPVDQLTKDDVDGEIDPTVIINIAKKVWDFLKEGEPVMNIDEDYGDAVPKGIERWDQMYGWSAPSSKSYRHVWKDGFGREIFVITYRVMWTHEGKVEGSDGLYVHQAQMVPAEVKVGWGWTVNAQCKVPEVLNTGTNDAPVGGIHLRLVYTLGSIMQKHHRQLDYFVEGNGSFKDLNKY